MSYIVSGNLLTELMKTINIAAKIATQRGG